MRRYSPEEGWGFGSRRLALVVTVLAAVAAVAFTWTLWSATRYRVPYSVIIPLNTGASVEVPARVVSVGIPAAGEPPPQAGVASSLTPVPTATSAVARGTRVRDPWLGPTRIMPSATGTDVSRQDVRQPQTKMRSTPPAIVPQQATSAPVVDPEPFRAEPTSQLTPRVETDPAVEIIRQSASPDQSRNSVVERRDTRRQAREAADALRDIRPR